MYTKESAEIDGSPMQILVFAPEGGGPFPGIVVAQHLPVAHMGLEGDPFTIDVGERLAGAGYACVIPYIFHWWPPEEDIAVKRETFRDDRVVLDMDAAYALLAGMTQVDSGRIGIIGHCWGGRVAWLAACHNPSYRAAAVLYGGRIKIAMGPDSVAPIELADRIPCPVLGIFGNDDENPSPADVDDLAAALADAGVAHEFHRYVVFLHGFQDLFVDDLFLKQAAADAWDKVLAFFADRLKP